MCIKFLPNFAAFGDRGAEDRDASVRFIAMPFWTTVISRDDRRRNRLIYRALVTLLATGRIPFPRQQPAQLHVSTYLTRVARLHDRPIHYSFYELRIKTGVRYEM